MLLRFIDVCTLMLVILYGLNAALVGICDCDVVTLTFGDRTTAFRAAQLIVGAAALYLVVASRFIVRRWGIQLPQVLSN